jgi:hypothetical protein
LGHATLLRTAQLALITFLLTCSTSGGALNVIPGNKIRIIKDKSITSITYIAMRSKKIKNRCLITGRIIYRPETKLVTKTQPNYLFDSPKLKKWNSQTEQNKRCSKVTSSWDLQDKEMSIVC